MKVAGRVALWGTLAVVGAAAGAMVWAGVESDRIATATPATGRIVTAGALRLHLTERQPVGAVRGTVLLLHGASGNQADVMLALGDRLAARGFRVVAPDRPGRGWSNRPDGEADASPSRQAALIRQGLAAIGVSHAIVLGHSLGGATAVAFALDQPDFTDGLVLVAPVTRPWRSGVAWYYRFAASPVVGPLFNRLVALPIGLLSIEAGVRSVFDPQTPPPRFSERTGVRLLLRPDDFAANAQDVEHMTTYLEAQAPREGAITAPTAIVTGDTDAIVLTALHSFGSHAAIPGSTLTVLKGVGHSPHWSDPESVVAAVVAVADRAGAVASRPE